MCGPGPAPRRRQLAVSIPPRLRSQGQAVRRCRRIRAREHAQTVGGGLEPAVRQLSGISLADAPQGRPSRQGRRQSDGGPRRSAGRPGGPRAREEQGVGVREELRASAVQDPQVVADGSLPRRVRGPDLQPRRGRLRDRLRPLRRPAPRSVRGCRGVGHQLTCDLRRRRCPWTDGAPVARGSTHRLRGARGRHRLGGYEGPLGIATERAGLRDRRAIPAGAHRRSLPRERTAFGHRRHGAHIRRRASQGGIPQVPLRRQPSARDRRPVAAIPHTHGRRKLGEPGVRLEVAAGGTPSLGRARRAASGRIRHLRCQRGNPNRRHPGRARGLVPPGGLQRRRSPLVLHYPGPCDHIPLGNQICHVHPAHDLAEHGVVVIQPEVVDEVDEELAVPGVTAPGGRPHGPTPVGHQAELVTSVGRVAGELVGARATTLKDEVRDYSVKRESVEVPGSGEPGEARCVGGGVARE